MTALEGFTAQPQAQRLLARMIQKGKLPHALLFTGMPGIGKKALALECAKAVNCLESPMISREAPTDTPHVLGKASLARQSSEEEPSREGSAQIPQGLFEATNMACQRCVACAKISRGVHPDVLIVGKEGTSIKLARIRTVKDRCRLHPYEAKRRVILIEDSQDLTEEASNALLKILEEPPASNLFILLAPEPSSLLPTIVSRCCHIRCRPLPMNTVALILQREMSVDPETAARIANLSLGSLELARAWVRQNRLERMNTALRRLEKALHSPMIDFFQDLAQWVKETEDLEEDLECIKFAVREVLLNKLAIDPERRGAAGPEAMKAPWGQLHPENLLHILDVLETAVQHHRAHAAKQLLLEAVCLKIKDVVYGEGGKGHRYPFPRGRKNLSL